MMNFNFFLFTTIFLLIQSSLWAQLDTDVKPYSENHQLEESIPALKLPSRDWTAERERLSKQEIREPKPYQFGYSFDTKIGMDAGQWTTLQNGDKIWRLRIISPDARSLNLVWDKFFIPFGGTLFIYNEDKTQMIGAYTQKQNNASETLSSWLIYDEELILEYNQPKTVNRAPRLHIGQVVHGLFSAAEIDKDLNESGDCNHDVKCSVGSDIENIKNHLSRAVGLLLVNGNSFCTGCLINNTALDETPYVLTANHCMGANPANIAVRFGWISEDPICAEEQSSPDGPRDMVMSGSELLASNANSDVALLRLNNGIPSDWDRVYAGWDRSGLTPDFTFGVHHPSGDIMKVCRDDDPPAKEFNAGAETWEILESGDGWDIGVTERGSSGSPLFNPAGQIIGQLFGGTAACAGTDDNDEFDYYGRFDVSWDAGDSPQNRLVDWLDPQALNTEFLTAFPPLEVPERDLAILWRVQAIQPDSECDFIEQAQIALIVENRGKKALDSISVDWQSSPIGSDSTFIPGPIDSAGSVVILDTLVPINQQLIAIAGLSYTGNRIDSIPENDRDTLNYSPPLPNVKRSRSATWILSIVTDDFPEETSWELEKDGQGVIASGGSFTQEQTLFKDTIEDVGKGCYTLNVFDSAGDGLCCGFGQGNFSLVDSRGDTLAFGGDFDRVSRHKIARENINYDAALLFDVRVPGDQPCFDIQELNLNLYVQNLGDSILDSIAIAIESNSGFRDTIFIPTLPIGQQNQIWDATVDVDEIIEAEIIDVNADEFLGNNMVIHEADDVEFDGAPLLSDTLVVVIHTDNDPEEISWVLSDEDGNPIASEDNYTQGETEFIHEIPLDNLSCYKFEITDSACDGIFVPGSYQIRSPDGTILRIGAGFDCSEVTSFYTDKTTSSERQTALGIRVYPNPSSDRVFVSPHQKVAKLTILNVQGQSILTSPVPEIDLSPLISGIYFMVVEHADGAKSIHKIIKK